MRKLTSKGDEMSDIYGLLGLVLILIGWIYETISAIKTGKTALPLAFAILYGTGSLLLTIHSWLLDDLIFLVLNLAATIIAVINIFLILKTRR